MARRLAALAAAAALLLGGCTPGTLTAGTSSGERPDADNAMSWPVPDEELTPGAVVRSCSYPRDPDERDVTAATKRTVAKWYRYTGPAGIEHVEYDHLIPFSLCGANGPDNIWPQPADGMEQGGFTHNRKDQLEAFTARQVRTGKWSLGQAQKVYRGDWRVAWCKYRDHYDSDGVKC